MRFARVIPAVLLLTAVAARGESARFAGLMAGSQDPAGSSFVFYPAAGNGSPDSARSNRFVLGYPVWRTPTDQALVLARVGYFVPGVSAILPTTGQRIPASLTELRVGAGYFHQPEPRRRVGGLVEVGTSTDVVFRSSRELTILASFVYSFPAGETGEWMLFLAYTNNRPAFSFLPRWAPLPGVAYVYRPSSAFQLVVGVPFLSFRWNIDERWRVSAGGTFGTFRGGVEYRPSPAVELYTELSMRQDGYLLHDRSDYDDRFSYRETRATAGARVTLIGGVLVGELGGGYALSRSFSIVRPTVGNVDRLTLGGGWLVTAGLRLTSLSGESKAAP